MRSVRPPKNFDFKQVWEVQGFSRTQRHKQCGSTAKLQIDSTPPGADIEVDGSFVGSTPSDVQVADGDHTVVVKKSGFKNWERKLKASAGSNVRVGAELEKADNP